MRKLLVLFLIIQQQIWAQQHTLELHLEEMPNEWVKLAVYKGLKSEIIGRGTVWHFFESRGSTSYCVHFAIFLFIGLLLGNGWLPKRPSFGKYLNEYSVTVDFCTRVAHPICSL